MHCATASTPVATRPRAIGSTSASTTASPGSGYAATTASRASGGRCARYQLVDLGTGLVVLDATAGSDAGIDVVGSEYATIAAERSALERLSDIVADQIVARVARYAQTAPEAGATP